MASAMALAAGTAMAQDAGLAHPDRWPALAAQAPDAAVEARIDALLAAMSLEQKVGQVIQGDIGSTTPEDVAAYHLGSILNGGSSSPGGDEFGPASAWVAAADAYYEASMRPNGKLPRIPVMWGSDAVHGHNNIVGATLFPHNIGLGAARNRALMEKIGQVTAIEMRVTGLDWTFAPTIAVARNDRWGRTYESFGEDPAIATSYAAALVHGLQGRRGDKDWLKGPHIIATAKHFLSDGGTEGGRDRGDAKIAEAELIRLHAPAYVAALKADVQSVMASFSGANDSPQAIGGAADNGAIAVRAVDRDAQEDAREIIWSGRSRGTLIVANPRAADLSGAGSLALRLDLRVDQAPSAPAMLEIRCGPGCSARLDIASRLAAVAGKGWQTLSIPLSCLPGARLDAITAPFALSSSTPMRLTLSSIALTTAKNAKDMTCR